MTSFEWYQFEDTTYGLTHLPENSHLCIKTPLALYYVSIDDNKELWKYTISTGSDELITSRTKNIVSVWHDRGVTRIYFGDSDEDDTTVYYWYITYPADGITDIGNIPPATYLRFHDYIKIGGSMELALTENVPAETNIRFYIGGNTHVMGDGFHRTYKVSYLTISGDDCWFLWKWNDENVELWYYDENAGTFTELESCGANTDISTDRNLCGIAYDDSDVLYFVLDVSGTNYLYSYIISTDTLTKLEQYDVSLMLDRNCIGTSGSPWEFEKAFHLTSSFTYQIHRGYSYLLKIQNLGLASGVTIKAITDEILIDSNKNVWKYIDYSDKISKLEGIYAINKLPKLRLEYKSPLSTDRVIIIYEYDSIATSWNNPCFYGKLGVPKYSNRHHNYSFRLENFGREDLTREIDDIASAEEIATTVINQINDNSDYLYTDATACPAIGVNNTNTWDDLKLKDNLYTLRILGNAFWYMDANGRVWFRKWANKVIQAQYYFNKPDYFKKETVGTSQTDIKWINSYAGGGTSDAVIIAIWQYHKNILRINHDGTNDPNLYHTITPSTTGILECYIGSDDVTRLQQIRIQEGGTDIIIIKFENDDLEYTDSLGADQKIADVLDDTLYYIKIQWYADNTFDVWLNETKEVDGVATRNNMSSGIDKIRLRLQTNAVYNFYFDAPGDPTDPEYSAGDNLKGVFHRTGDVGAPSPKRVQEQFNIWKIYGGWNSATNKPFEKELTDDEHIQRYGPLKWTGRDLFTEARTQASCDAIATALNVWQGMQDNPDDVIIDLYGYEFVGVGKSFKFTWDYYLGDTTLLSTTTDYIIAKNRINFKTGKQKLTLSTNIVSRGASI